MFCCYLKHHWILLLLFSYVICNCFSFNPTIIHNIHQTNTANSKIHIPNLIPIKYLINWDIPSLGYILTSISTLSLHAFASIISTPLYSHSFLNNFPISAFSFDILFVLYTLIEILYDIYNFIYCVINYCYPYE